MAKVCYLIFIFTSSVLALVNCQRDLDLPTPSCSSSSFVSNSSCSQIIYGMINCISFLGTGASVAKPDGSCCSGFKSVLKANSDCICQAMKEAPQMGIQLNMTRAAELPSACGISHFSVSKNCDFSNSPGTAPPAKSPKPSPKTPTPTPALRKAPAPTPLPSTKNHTFSPPKTTPTPTPTTSVKSPPKSPGPSLPKSKNNKGSDEDFSQVSGPAPTNLNSGSYSLNVSFAIVFSICTIYLLLPLFEI